MIKGKKVTFFPVFKSKLFHLNIVAPKKYTHAKIHARKPTNKRFEILKNPPSPSSQSGILRGWF